MANFFDAITGAEITNLEIKQGVKFRLGVDGGGPPPKNERLNVTTSSATAPSELLKASDPAVKFIKEDPKGSRKFIFEIDPAKMQGSTVRACWNGSDYAAAVTVVSESTLEIRESIVTMARSFVEDAHYLWGTAGNEPGQSNGNPGGGKHGAAMMRKYSLDPKATERDKVLAVCTACSYVDGYSTCAGRSESPGVGSATPPDLDAFLKSCQDAVAKGNTNQTTWTGAGPHGDLFPRKYYWRGMIQEAGRVVWGESCDEVRHFDCVGLVNYCYAQHWYQPNFGLDIAAFRNANQGTTKIDDAKDLMDADILIKPGNNHIAMLYDSGNGWCVVQAAWTTKGLTEDEKFNPTLWDRYRMNDAYLVGEGT
jgi:cell wall-associated NlpC family hydrolase